MQSDDFFTIHITHYTVLSRIIMLNNLELFWLPMI